MDNNKQTPQPRKRQSSLGSKEISRRKFVIGGVCTCAALTIGGVAYYTASTSNTTAGTKKLSVESPQVLTIDNFEEVGDVQEFLKVEREITLEHNTSVTQCSNEVLTLLEPTNQGSPLITACTLSLQTANKTKLLSSALTQKPRFDILDFKANEKGYVWIESNVLTGENIVMTCVIDTDLAKNAKVALKTGYSEKMPKIELFQDCAWIQTSSSDSSQKEKLYRIKLSEDEDSLEQIIETRSFATAPTYCSDGIIITPRNAKSTSNYDIRLLSPTNAKTIDILTLPQSMKPQDVSHGTSGFSFTFQANYNYGDGISNLGTYVQSQSATSLKDETDESFDEHISELSETNWLAFNREPTCPCAWIGEYVAIKSTSSVAVIDIKNKKYALIKADDGADDYGVWLVSSGTTNRLVTLQNINYTPITGNLIKEGRLKVWKA